MTTTSHFGVTGSLKHRPVPAHPLTNAANLLERAAGLVEDAAREVALAAAQAPLNRPGGINPCESQHAVGENPVLRTLTRYASSLADDSLDITARSAALRGAVPR